MVTQRNVQARFSTDEESWPPDQPKNFTPLALIHHRNQYVMKQATEMAQLIQTANDDVSKIAENHPVSKNSNNHESLQKALDRSNITKEVGEILVPLEQCEGPQLILIEGAPGIGKSILLKEIAYRWGIKQLLTSFKLVLLIHLRDPIVQQATLIKDLIQPFCCRDARAIEVATACSDHLIQNGGKELVFLFDGFDEFPVALQKNSLINDIIQRKVLPQCGLVVSSRPHASVGLRELATVRVHILGFSDAERKQYIEQTLDGQPKCIEELTKYLEQHFPINSLCYAPINMTILLYLYKQGIPLPRNSTVLYNHFICLTICRYLRKYGCPIENKITDLGNLPSPCNEIVAQLSKLALEGLNNNKLVFTIEEIEAFCPNIATVPGAINCFGLLQAVQHFGLTQPTMTFNFLHFSIQEFLAAYHVTQLLPYQELQLLEEKFCSSIHSNMFSIYVSLTKGQRPSFKNFIQPSLVERFKGFLSSEETKISNQFLDNQLQCIRLFRCYYNVGDTEICKSIENAKTFKNKIIDLEHSKLAPSDVESMTLFLTCSSHKEWKELYLWGCYIQDHGVQILHLGMTTSNITITALELDSNGLTESSSNSIRDIAIRCRVKLLGIGGNVTIGEDKRLYSILTDSLSEVEELYMDSIMLSSNAAIELFNALGEGTKLKLLWIVNNCVNDEACNAIIMAMKKNTSLCELRMEQNPISGESAQKIVQALEDNNALEELSLPYYPQYIEDKIRLSMDVNKKRQSRGCRVMLKINFKRFSRFRRLPSQFN